MKKKEGRKGLKKVKAILGHFYSKKNKKNREITAAFFYFILLLFILFSMLNLAENFGQTFKEEVMYKYFGYTSYLIIIILLYAIYQNLVKKILPSWVFWFGSFSFLLASTTLLSVSINDEYGGIIGSFVGQQVFNILGQFGFVIVIVVMLLSLVLLKIISPIKIYDWIASGNKKNQDAGYEDETEGKEEEEEEEVEEEYEAGEAEEVEEGEVEEEIEEDFEEDLEKEVKNQIENSKNIKINDKENIDSKQGQRKYIPPQIQLLKKQKNTVENVNTKLNSNTIIRVLDNFKIKVNIEGVKVGPTFTRYSLKPAEGVRLQKISALQNNLELALAAHPIRIEAPIPGQSLVGIEVPNSKKAMIRLRQLLQTKSYALYKKKLGLIIGKTVDGEVFVKDLTKMPHILIAGTTGSGKSVLIHDIIISLIFNNSPAELKFIFIDPKRVELTLYKGIPHLYTEPMTNSKDALKALNWCVLEMERRYELLESVSVRDLNGYNKVAKNKLPKIVVVIDELADLMQTYPREIEGAIVRIAQKSRAIGIHLILSTQRPSVNIITGLVKANIPVRIGLQVSSQIDSRTIIDMPGCENLVGYGDLLFTSAEYKKPIRVQAAFISEDEVKAVVDYLIKKNSYNLQMIDFDPKQSSTRINIVGSNEDDDPLYIEAKNIIISTKKASTSFLQRKLKIGYSRAARLIDMLEEDEIVGPAVGNKPRDILVESDIEE